PPPRPRLYVRRDAAPGDRPGRLDPRHRHDPRLARAALAAADPGGLRHGPAPLRPPGRPDLRRAAGHLFSPCRVASADPERAAVLLYARAALLAAGALARRKSRAGLAALRPTRRLGGGPGDRRPGPFAGPLRLGLCGRIP